MSTPADVINWDDGNVVTIRAGMTFRCNKLKNKQLYAVLLYNSAQTDVNADVKVVWDNSHPPATVTIPGTTGDEGPASFVFISGTDAKFISISAPVEPSQAKITAFIVSVAMPLNSDGLNNIPLPDDGNFHSFDKYTRYSATIASGWCTVTVKNNARQFVCLQIVENKATLIVVNYAGNPIDKRVTKLGPVASKTGTVNIKSTGYQSDAEDINNGNWVWMNGDSQQDSASALIALQRLSPVKAMYMSTGVPQLLARLNKAFFRTTADETGTTSK